MAHVLHGDDDNGTRLRLERVIDVAVDRRWGSAAIQNKARLEHQSPQFQHTTYLNGRFDGALSQLITDNQGFQVTYFTSTNYGGGRLTSSIYPIEGNKPHYARATGYLDFTQHMMLWEVDETTYSYRGAKVYVLTGDQTEHAIIANYNEDHDAGFLQVDVDRQGHAQQIRRVNGQWRYNDYTRTRKYTNIALLRAVDNTHCIWDAVEHIPLPQ